MAAMGQAYSYFQTIINQSKGDSNPPSRQLYPSLCPTTSASILDLVAQLGKNHLAGTPNKEIKLPAVAEGAAHTAPMTGLFSVLQQTMAPAGSIRPSTAETIPPVVAPRVARPGKLPIHPEPEFANRSLFCRFAYVVDLDTETFEVYGDGRDNKNLESKHTGHRFRNVRPPEADVPNLVATITFAEVRA
ncbi:hypothetical protein F4679DRAFT_597054 [Xylaria curta]|nr:hypothetical protein F4679DRAFT_597054 [Xylaria curta]